MGIEQFRFANDARSITCEEKNIQLNKNLAFVLL
jgi:hypothetical protein